MIELDVLILGKAVEQEENQLQESGGSFDVKGEMNISGTLRIGPIKAWMFLHGTKCPVLVPRPEEGENNKILMVLLHCS